MDWQAYALDGAEGESFSLRGMRPGLWLVGRWIGRGANFLHCIPVVSAWLSPDHAIGCPWKLRALLRRHSTTG